ncbi:MAG: biotin--[acetyl-CoA-carboxylase] ligase [Puia sp.]|nr:biotin--[acetyl-CoA-carboxylase] ligase [Puia sp.]
MPHPASILSHKPDPPIGQPFVELGSVDSTNNYATARIHEGLASHGSIFFAHDQFAGKGQRGKTWNSRPGDNIVMSLILEPSLGPGTAFSLARPFPLSACIALSCHDFFSRYAGAGETSVKWPNDLYWRDRKAGGILIENICRGTEWLFAVVGIGININQVAFPETVRNPVSLKQITGRDFDAVALARELATVLDTRYNELMTGGKTRQLAAYNACLYKRNQAVRLKKGQAVFDTTIQGVSGGGELLTRDTLERSFTFGEVEWIL